MDGVINCDRLRFDAVHANRGRSGRNYRENVPRFPFCTRGYPLLVAEWWYI